jgi:hypothetical protein
MALFESAEDAIWLRNLLCEFGFCPGSAPTTIFHDNQGSIVWDKEDSLRKVKHVALRYHFTHNLINAGQIVLTYVESKSSRADIMCLICMVPRVHGASPTHSCCIKCIRFKQFQ